MSLIWCDTETTGLDPRKERLLEVAVIVTDDAFREVERLHLVTDEARSVDWSKIDAVVLEMHCKNGLWGESLARGLPLHRCAQILSDLITKYTEIRPATDATADKPAQPSRVIAPQLAGSGVAFDREMLRYHAPHAEQALHYRNLDMTAFVEMSRRAWPEIHKARPDQGSHAVHRAMPDIEHSLRTAIYFSNVLRLNLPDQVKSGLTAIRSVYLQPIQVHDGQRSRTESMRPDEAAALAWLDAVLAPKETP